jgi:hypothetical protein
MFDICERATLSAVIVRESGMIQYSEASVIEAKVRGVLDTRLRGYDGLLWSCIRHRPGMTVSRSRSLARHPIAAYL